VSGGTTSRVTTGRRLTVPKEIANDFAIQPGCEVEWLIASDAIHIVPRVTGQIVAQRLALFDAATERQKARDRTDPTAVLHPDTRRPLRSRRLTR